MGFCTTRAAHALVALLGLGMAGCDSQAPAPFDAAVTSSDIRTMTALFGAGPLRSLELAAADVDATTGSGATAALGQLALASGRAGDAARYMSRIRGVLPVQSTAAPSLAAGELPPELLGTTYVYSTADGRYVVSGRTGAPADGVRFILYAVDSSTGAFADPLTETGYADVTASGTISTRTAHIVVVWEGATRLDYSLEATATADGGRVLVSGFVSDGTTRADFRLDNRVVITGATTGEFTLDYAVDVPARNLSFDYHMLIRADGSTGAGSVELALTLNGSGGRVDLTGSYTLAGEGTLQVDVNGGGFATITVGPAGIEIVGREGTALTEAERDALRDIFAAFEQGLDVLEVLLRPVETLTMS